MLNPPDARASTLLPVPTNRPTVTDRRYNASLPLITHNI
jgi:hypothetical protein